MGSVDLNPVDSSFFTPFCTVYKLLYKLFYLFGRHLKAGPVYQQAFHSTGGCAHSPWYCGLAAWVVKLDEDGAVIIMNGISESCEVGNKLVIGDRSLAITHHTMFIIYTGYFVNNKSHSALCTGSIVCDFLIRNCLIRIGSHVAHCAHDHTVSDC